MPYAGNTNEVATKAYCHRAYWTAETTQLYWSLQTTRTWGWTPWSYNPTPTAREYAELLLKEAPEARAPVYQQLVVITNVSKAGGSSYCVALELALTAGMHLILMGKNFKKLQQVEKSILAEWKRRQQEKKSQIKDKGEQEKDKEDKQQEEQLRPKIFKVKMDSNSVASITEAAQDVIRIVSSTSASDYEGKIACLIHNPAGVVTTPAYETTADGIEVNVGRNFVAPHVLTQELLPYLKAAATATHKPRIVHVSSIGHCQGNDFDPERFLQVPEEGGAPEDTFIPAPEENDESAEQGDVKKGYHRPAADIDNNEEEDYEGGSEEEQTTPVVKTKNKNNRVYADNEIDSAVRMYYRSKMALIADALAMSKEEPSLSSVSVYPGSVANSHTKRSLGIAETVYQTGFYMFQLDPTQAARSSLRAALDPDMNTVESLQGAYLHCDGNPWTVAEPTSPKSRVNEELPSESQLTTLDLTEYAQNVRKCTKQLCAKIIAVIAVDNNKEKVNKPPAASEEEDNVSTENLTEYASASDDN